MRRGVREEEGIRVEGRKRMERRQPNREPRGESVGVYLNRGVFIIIPLPI